MNTKDIWNLYATDLRHFIISKVKNETIADDILQDTFIKVHVNLHNLNDVSKLKSWIFQIGRNTMMDYFRTHNSRINLDDSFSNHAEETNQDHSEMDCLKGILENLPKKYRKPLFLSDIKGLRQQEFANQLELPLPTVKSQIQRGRKLIAQGFMDCCGFVMYEQGFLVGEIRDRQDCKVCN